MSNIAAAIITIGDELLIGQTVDTNSAWIAQRLNELGIDVHRRIAVGDSKPAIVQALDAELAQADILIITGGLGPTADDITKPLLAEYFGGKLVENELVLEHLKDMFAKRSRPIIARNMKQAEVPDNCEILFNKMGTAPGMWFERNGRVTISLPGVPFEMMSIMNDEVLPRLTERYISDALLHQSIITAGEGESFIADKIQDLEEALPGNIKLAYLPCAGMVKLRLTGRSGDAAGLTNELQMHAEAIANRLGNIVVGMEDIPMEAIMGKWFIANKKTLGLAESCTGGGIASDITNIPGSSKYFMGSTVSYSYEAKHDVLGVSKETIAKTGAVSEETVQEMAQGTLRVLRCDYALAVSGMLSPGTDTDKVSGTVWMAVASKDSMKTKKFLFQYDRPRNKEMAIAMAKLMIWKFVNGQM